MSTPQNTRLFLELAQNTPTIPMYLTSETQVANFYGLGSKEDILARQYFTGPNAAYATMIFARDNSNQRPHVLGANLPSLSQLQRIAGSLSFQFAGYDYSTTIDLASATDYKSAASLLTKALSPGKTQATLLDSWVQPETINFTGTVAGQVVAETSGAPLVIGGRIIAPGENLNGDAAANQVILNPMAGVWTTEAGFDHISTPTPMSETYSILHVGSAIGNFQIGQKLVGPGVPILTCIIADLGNGAYLLNNQFSTSPGTLRTAPPPLYVRYNTVAGKTQNRSYFSVQPNGNFGFDATPSTLSFASGSVADLLGLSQASGALISPLGGQDLTTSQVYNSLVKATNDAFSSFQDELGRYHGSILWAEKHPQYTYIQDKWTTPPAGQTTGYADAHALLSAPLASEATLHHHTSVHGGWELAVRS